MAAKFQHEKPLEDMMRNLKVDPSSDVGNNNKAGTKGGNHLDANTFVPSPGVMINNVKGDMGQEYLISDQGGYYPMNGYYGYYYPGFDGSFGEWDEQAYFSGPDGVELQYPVVQGDNGQLFYYTPGFQFGYDAYGSPYIPGTMVGMDGQYMSQQPFFPGAVLQQPVSSQVFSPPPVAYGNDMFPAYTWETSPLAIDGTNGNGMVSGLTVPVQKSNLSSSTHTVAPAKSAAPPKSHNTIEKDTKPMIDALPSNQTLKPANKVSQQASTLPASTALAKGYFPISKFPDKSGLLYPGAIINPKASGQGWIGPEKLKGRGKANGLTGFDWLNEQNRGPRTTGPKNSLTSNGDSVGNTNSVTTSAIQKDYYNLSDFQTKYDHAMFYVIKSYSEDDVHKSIKYNVWASTTNGNKRLENAYQDAQKKVEEKGSKCPVFLFFSVNASGQFCGVAEMTGRVDFDKSMDFWQQDKWTGFFPVKWHIIKDVPNTQFRHIILENNDNKPVTNSRDAQEVKFSQGIEMLNIFKNYSAKTSILDDFGFYESRQKIMQDKRVRPLAANPEHFQKKIDDALKVPDVGALETDTNPSTKLAVIKDELELSGEVKE